MTSIAERLEAKYVPEPNTGCWLWQGALTGGYGRFHAEGRERRAHRVVYELHRGKVPDGLDLDHLCRVRRCVNPAHLEPVTRRVNLLRGDTLPAAKAAQDRCVHGHIFDARNTHIQPNGTRKCRRCVADRKMAASRVLGRKPATYRRGCGKCGEQGHDKRTCVQP